MHRKFWPPTPVVHFISPENNRFSACGLSAFAVDGTYRKLNSRTSTGLSFTYNSEKITCHRCRRTHIFIDATQDECSECGLNKTNHDVGCSRKYLFV